MSLYQKFFKPIVFLLEPEKAHNLTLGAMAFFNWTRLDKLLIKPFFTYSSPYLETQVAGLHFPNPIGLPAGCDKKGNTLAVWESYGFGWATAGSITFLPQYGNPKPRLFRMPKDLSMQVNLGLNSIGVMRFQKNIKKRKPSIPYGISIARSTSIKEEEVIQDYVMSFEKLKQDADYFEINISCPNIPENDYFKQGSFLKDLLSEIQKRNTTKKPLFLKIGPVLEKKEKQAIIQNCFDFGINGIIISNLLKENNLKTSFTPLRQGGLSGKLLEPFANQTLAEFYKETEGKIPLVGLGGIFTAEDAYRKIKLGASLLQLYTGMVYQGPGLIKQIVKGLEKLLKQDGLTNIQNAIGKDNQL